MGGLTELPKPRTLLWERRKASFGKKFLPNPAFLQFHRMVRVLVKPIRIMHPPTAPPPLGRRGGGAVGGRRCEDREGGEEWESKEGGKR